MTEPQYKIGTMLYRRKKSSTRCGDLFIIAESLSGGYRVLSFRKDGRINTSFVETEVLNKLYVPIGHTHEIENWLYLAKRKDQ